MPSLDSVLLAVFRWFHVIAGITWIAAPVDAGDYAHDLYANLRILDAAGCDAILVEQLPHSPEWVAVNDRLGRAAAGSRPPSAS